MKVFVVFVMVLLLATLCRGQERYPLETYRDYGKDTESWSISPPKIYSSDGTYLGELSKSRYRPDSVSNRYGAYGSKYSPTSINNPYSPWGRYRTQPVYIYQSRW